MSLESGELLAGRYRIGRVLGKGGFGAVYLATDESLGLPCAVKENLSVSPEAERQFRREATLLANLRHPNLPRVTNHFVLSGQQYLVMDYVEGEDLKQRLAGEGALPETKVMPWALQICDALDYLHNRKPPVIHRDIKPANIKLTASEEAMLVDFGIAKASAPGQQTTTGAMALSPGFAPPEQYGMGGTDQRSDEYAFAATLYNLFTGKMPCDSMERLLGHETLKPLAELRPDLSPHIVAAITRALSIPPHYRFQSVADFKAALTGKAFAEDLTPAGRRPQAGPAEAATMPAAARSPVTMVRPPAETRAVAPKRRSWGWVIGLLAAVAVLGVLAVLAVGLTTPLWMPLLTQRLAPQQPLPAAALATATAALTARPATPTLPAPTATATSAPGTPTATPRPTLIAPASTAPPASPTQASVTISSASAPYLARLAQLGTSGLAPFALSPDGKAVALTNAGGIDIVALATGEVLKHLNAFWGKTPVLAVAYLSDSLLIQSPQVINRWDMKSGTFRQYPLTGHALYVSANGRRMVVPHDKYGQVLDVESGALLFNKGNPNSYYQFTPDGAYLAWADPGDQPGSTNLVNWVTVASPQADRVLAGHGKPLRALTTSPDGKWLISASGDVWDTATGKLAATFDSSAQKVAVSADSQVILGLDGELYSVATGQELGRLAQPMNATQLAFTPDGQSLLVQTADNTVEVWAVDAQQMAAAAAGPKPTAAAAQATPPSSEAISVGNAAHLALQGWWGSDRLLEARLLRDVAGAAQVFGPAAYGHVALNAAGTEFAGVTGSDVDLVDLASGQAVGHLSGLSSPQEAVFLGDRFLLVTTANGVERWDLQTNALKQTYTISGHALTASPDGKKFALQDDRFVSVVDVLTGEAVQASSDPHCDFAFTPDSHYLASTIGVNVALWDVAARQQKTLPGQRGVKTAGLAFSPDGKMLLTATGDVWDWNSGKWLRKFDGAASQLAVSADGQLLAESDGSLFEAATGKLIGSLLDMRGPADALAFALGGSRLLWHTAEGRLYVWGVNAAVATPTPAAIAADAISSAQPVSLTLQARWGKGKLYSAQWSPDERYLAVNTSLNTIIYQGDSLEPVQTRWGATTLAVGAAGQAVVVEPAGLKVLDVATGREVRAWPLPGVTAATFSPDGATVAVMGQVVDKGQPDGVALLSLSDGSVRVLNQGRGAFKAALGAAYSADGKYLATSFRGAIWIWDVAAGKQARPPIGNAALPAQFSPDGQYVAYCTDRQMVVERVLTGYQVLVTNLDGTPYFPSGRDIDPLVPLSQHFLADGTLVVIYQTQRAHTVTLARWKTDAAAQPETLHSNLVALDSLRGYFAATYDQDRLHHLPVLELGPAGKKFYSLTADGVVRVWDFSSGQQVAATAPDYLETMALSPDGQTAALASATGGLDLLDLATGKVTQTIAGAWYPRALVYDSPSVLMMLYPGSAGDGDHLAVVDLAQKDVIEDQPGAFYNASRGFSLSPDGRLAAFWEVVNYQDVLGLFTLSFGQPLFTFDKLNGAEQATAFSPDGQYVVRANGNKVEFWNIQTRQLERGKTLTGKRAPFGDLVFSADGQWLFSGSGDVWNLATGKTVVNVSSKATRVALSPNGQVIAGDDGSLWNAATGEKLGQLSGMLGPASQLAFTPDGRKLIVQTAEGVVEVWGAKP